MTLHSLNDRRYFKIKNKTLIEYASEYVRNMRCNNDIIYYINFIRIKKAVVYIFKVVEFKGNQKIEYYNNINKMSLVRRVMGKTRRYTNQ